MPEKPEKIETSEKTEKPEKPLQIPGIEQIEAELRKEQYKHDYIRVLKVPRLRFWWWPRQL